MNMKRKLASLLLAASMMASLAAPAYAAPAKVTEPVDAGMAIPNPNPGIMPMSADLYDNAYISSKGVFITHNFSVSTSNGADIRCWYQNQSDADATVCLYGKSAVTKQWVVVLRMNVPAGASDFSRGSLIVPWYTEFYVRIDTNSGNSLIKGYLRVAQLDYTES